MIYSARVTTTSSSFAFRTAPDWRGEAVVTHPFSTCSNVSRSPTRLRFARQPDCGSLTNLYRNASAALAPQAGAMFLHGSYLVVERKNSLRERFDLFVSGRNAFYLFIKRERFDLFVSACSYTISCLTFLGELGSLPDKNLPNGFRSNIYSRSAIKSRRQHQRR
jgi:hypothetical protein